MDDATIYSRAYSTHSERQLVSGRGPHGGTLLPYDLLNDFRNHVQRTSRIPTALVSVSSRIVDTVTRAFDIYYQNSCPLEDIWIAFIEATTHSRVHSAQELAQKCELPEPGRFCYEFLFEWNIPERCVLHRVSLHTLMDRGLGEKLPFINRQMTTSELRRCIAEELGPIGPHHGGWEIGHYVSSFARTFGARAPIDWIARRLFDDCVCTEAIHEGWVRLRFANEYFATVSIEFFSDLDHGIETTLYDWWLADMDFFLGLRAFEEWRDVLEESIVLDYIDCFETSHDDKTKDGLLAKHAEIRETIEERAIELGL